MAVGRGDRAAAHQQARPGNGAGRDDIAQLEGRAVAAPEIAQGGDAGEERVAGVDRAAQPHRHVSVTLDVLEGYGACAERQVDVRVHEAGDDGVAREVQALRLRKARRQLGGVAGGGDALAAHGDRPARDGILPGAIDQPVGGDQPHGVARTRCHARFPLLLI